jgi:transcriptional regulator with XRE-family HTH domain
MNLGHRIKRLRKLHEISRSALAQKSGLSYRNLYRIELGGEPQFGTLEKIAGGLFRRLMLTACRDGSIFRGSLGEMLRWARLQAGMGTPRVSALTKVDRRTLCRYEKGEVCPLPSLMHKLMHCYGAKLRIEFRLLYPRAAQKES